MEIIHHLGIEKDLKNLKRFSAPRESLDAWERFFIFKGLRETPGLELYPGFGQNKIYKARAVPLKENCGKSNGYRLIFRILENEVYEILVFSRHGIYQNENDLKNLIRLRLNL